MTLSGSISVDSCMFDVLRKVRTRLRSLSAMYSMNSMVAGLSCQNLKIRVRLKSFPHTACILRGSRFWNVIQSVLVYRTINIRLCIYNLTNRSGDFNDHSDMCRPLVALMNFWIGLLSSSFDLHELLVFVTKYNVKAHWNQYKSARVSHDTRPFQDMTFSSFKNRSLTWFGDIC